jgi:hypothetical protein
LKNWKLHSLAPLLVRDGDIEYIFQENASATMQ